MSEVLIAKWTIDQDAMVDPPSDVKGSNVPIHAVFAPFSNRKLFPSSGTNQSDTKQPSVRSSEAP